MRWQDGLKDANAYHPQAKILCALTQNVDILRYAMIEMNIRSNIDTAYFGLSASGFCFNKDSSLIYHPSDGKTYYQSSILQLTYTSSTR